MALSEHDVKNGNRWSRDTIIASIRLYCLLSSELPTAGLWKTGGPWPSYNAVRRHFGSWAEAIEAAGYARPRQGYYERAGKSRGPYKGAK